MKPLLAAAAIVVSLGVLYVGLSLVSGDGSQADDDGPTRSATSLSGAELRSLVETSGGVDALRIAEAAGAFDLVRFDPHDPDIALAANRLSYGEAENQRSNERWTIAGERVEQELWAPETPHDFAHFNADGTITRWIHGGGPDFAPRIAQVLDRTGAVVVETEPMYANRFATDNRRVFALLGDGVYGSRAQHVGLIVDDGQTRQVLAGAGSLAWIDVPAPGLLVAYPASPGGSTQVWNTATLEPVRGHALGGRAYVRTAISADGSTAVGVDFEGGLDVIDLRTGRQTHSFGDFTIEGIDRPLTLSDDGSLVVVVQLSGAVEVWSVDDSTRVLSIAGESAQPRWLSETYAARSATAVSANAERLAVRNPARPDVTTTWSIIDLDFDRLLGSIDGQ